MTNEKKLLFVDDQWCTEKGRDNLIGEYGDLQESKGYTFAYETAFNGFEYSTQQVIDRVRSENPMAVILDMNFSHETSYKDGRKFGKKILESLIQENPDLPVFIHSSLSDQNLVKECLSIGAKTWLRKRASKKQLEDTINMYCKEKNQNDRRRK